MAGADAMKAKVTAVNGDGNYYAGLYWQIGFGAKSNVKVKPNTKYTFSFWIKTEILQGRGYAAAESFNMEGLHGGRKDRTMPWTDVKATNEWERKSYTFTTGATGYIMVGVGLSGSPNFSGLIYICRPKLEEGDTATPWCAYDVTADALEQITSIFIKDNKIQLNARNTEVSGDLSVGSLKTTPKATGDPFVEVHDGEFNIFTFERKKGIELSVDDSGMPHLIFYDKAGNPAYDLGWTGMKQLTDAVAQEYWSADFLMKEESYTDAKAVSNITRDKCKEYYTYHAAYNRKTGTYGSNEEYNNVTFVEKSFRNQRIADGWYYPVNNGSLARIADERAYIYGTQKFQYSNGKMIGYENVFIEKDTENGAWRFSNYQSGGGRRGGGSIGGGSRGSDSSAPSQP